MAGGAARSSSRTKVTRSTVASQRPGRPVPCGAVAKATSTGTSPFLSMVMVTKREAMSPSRARAVSIVGKASTSSRLRSAGVDVCAFTLPARIRGAISTDERNVRTSLGCQHRIHRFGQSLGIIERVVEPAALLAVEGGADDEGGGLEQVPEFDQVRGHPEVAVIILDL